MNARQKSALTKIFAVAGAVLLWAPILFMFLTAIVGSIARKSLIMDYLLLAEVFPIVALGLVLLVLATLLSRSFRKLIGWGSAAALLALVATNIVAAATGLASGAIKPEGAPLIATNICIAIFDILILVLAILAIFLLKHIFRKEPNQAPEAEGQAK
jgi:hypothetical protein